MHIRIVFCINKSLYVYFYVTAGVRGEIQHHPSGMGEEDSGG